MYAPEIAERDPERVAVLMTRANQRWTFQELEAESNRVAHLLRKEGLKEGDGIAVMMMNAAEMIAIQAGAERTGLYHTSLNWHLKPAEVAFIINNSEARIVFTQSRLLDLARELPALCPVVEKWVMVDAPSDSEPFEDYRGLVDPLATSHVPNERTGRPLPYSSGTTGQPKGILRALPGTHPSDAVPMEKVAVIVYQFREGMVYLEPAPMYHAAVHSHISSALRIGGTTLIMDRFNAEEFLSIVDEYRVTHAAVVPTMFTRLLELPDEVRARYDVSSLEAVVHSAAPCPPVVKRRMIDWLGPIIHEHFGATEGNGATSVSAEEWLERPGTVGRPVFGSPVILDPEGQEVPPGTIGQIWWRGPTNFTYLKDDEKTAETIIDKDGPLSSVGDIGYLDEDGYLYPTDRASFMIIRGGVNVYPQEVENHLVEHPAVADVAVFGIPDRDLGEAVQALVELRAEYSPSAELEAELITYCREHLAKFKCPSAIDFTDQLPRIETGKVQKKLLRAQYAERALETQT